MAQTKGDVSKGTEQGLIRVDRHGRCRYSEEFRRDAVAAFERSGMSGIGFARQCGVKYSTFAYWVKRSREKRGGNGGAVGGFAVAQIEGVGAHEARPASAPAEGGSELAVELPGGARARVGTPGGVDLLCRLLRGLVSSKERTEA